MEKDIKMLVQMTTAVLVGMTVFASVAAVTAPQVKENTTDTGVLNVSGNFRQACSNCAGGYHWRYREYVDECPHCGREGSLYATYGGVSTDEGRIRCNRCGADFCGYCGKDQCPRDIFLERIV